MQNFFKNIALSLWTNHRKKLVAFLLGLLFAGLAAVSGIPIEEIKDAAREASKPAVVQPLPEAAVKPLLGPEPAPAK